MRWTEPDFTEISLNMEMTAYVRAEGDGKPHVVRSDERPEASGDHRSAG